MLTVIAIFWVVIWLLTLIDLFRRDWGIGKKLVWALVMLILPVVGVIAYLIVRPPSASDIAAGAASRGAPEERARDRHPV